MNDFITSNCGHLSLGPPTPLYFTFVYYFRSLHDLIICLLQTTNTINKTNDD